MKIEYLSKSNGNIYDEDELSSYGVGVDRVVDVESLVMSDDDEVRCSIEWIFGLSPLLNLLDERVRHILVSLR